MNRQNKSPVLAGGQVAVSLEEVCLIHWESLFPCESCPAPGQTCKGTSLIAPGLWFRKWQDVWDSGASGAVSVEVLFWSLFVRLSQLMGKLDASFQADPVWSCLFMFDFERVLIPHIFSAFIWASTNEIGCVNHFWCFCIQCNVNVFFFFAGLLTWMHQSHVSLWDISRRLSNARKPGFRYDTVEWKRFWRKVHLHCERPSFRRRVWKQLQDTSREIFTKKPCPKTVPQPTRGK